MLFVWEEKGNCCIGEVELLLSLEDSNNNICVCRGCKAVCCVEKQDTYLCVEENIQLHMLQHANPCTTC